MVSRNGRTVARGKDVQPFDLQQLSDDVFRHAVAKVFIFLGAAEILEIEHGERLRGAAQQPQKRMELIGVRPDSDSRLRRCKSARISEAFW